MGCCFSSNPRRHHDSSRSPPRPPPPPPEEEAVKEVLSETPLHAESLTPKAATVVAHQKEKVEEAELAKKIPILKLEEVEEDEDVPFPEESNNASEYSELCSVGDQSFSTATTTTTTAAAAAERGEVDNAVTSRDYSEVVKIRQRGVRRSSSRVPRKPSSPALKSPVQARSVRGREFSQGRSMQRTVEQSRSRSELAYQNSRSSAGVGGARRGSPAKRGGGNSSSSKSMVGGLSRDGNIAKTLLLTDENENYHSKPTADESLDNPLVSLECFIFLGF